jgi:hypothetical protein
MFNELGLWNSRSGSNPQTNGYTSAYDVDAGPFTEYLDSLDHVVFSDWLAHPVKTVEEFSYWVVNPPTLINNSPKPTYPALDGNGVPLNDYVTPEDIDEDLSARVREENFSDVTDGLELSMSGNTSTSSSPQIIQHVDTGGLCPLCSAATGKFVACMGVECAECHDQFDVVKCVRMKVRAEFAMGRKFRTTFNLDTSVMAFGSDPHAQLAAVKAPDGSSIYEYKQISISCLQKPKASQNNNLTSPLDNLTDNVSLDGATPVSLSPSN